MSTHMVPYLLHRASLALVLTAALSACGGGGSPIASGNIPTGTTTTGTITGFGSVIVNGVRYSETRATVTSDDDASFARSDLQLGMVVEIEGDINSDGVTGKARTIRARSETEGAITALDTTAMTLTVLDQTVAVNAQTVFPGGAVQPSQLSDLHVNDRVEIHGLRTDATHITATHIERKASGSLNKIRGLVSALDTTAQTFALNGTLTVSYSGVTLPAGVQNGSFVKVISTAAPDPATHVLQASQILVSGRENIESHTAGQHSEIEGAVTDFNSISDFKINGVAIDASGATGTDSIAAGAILEVKGSFNNAGVLVVTEVEAKSKVVAREAYELIGPITDFVSVSNFKVKGVLVDASGVTLTGVTLADGLYIEVKGAMSGQTLLASSIKTENVARLDD